ncbi:MAG: hybrid sensor histidine kinase/response regulator [Caldilineaceae bacterium]|nr:hybrid sensor histidine kinase/response regulator [Caldilineaceae bacterium]
MTKDYTLSESAAASILGEADMIFADGWQAPVAPVVAKLDGRLPPWKILIVDDEVEVHQVTQLALQNFSYTDRGLIFLSAYSAQEAQALLHLHTDIAIILLDVVMENNQAGLQLVKYIREEIGNRTIRIILRTGQPGEAPEEAVIRQYDINDYKTKTELTRQRLIATILVSLRAYEHILQVENSQWQLAKLNEALTLRNVELVQARDAAEAANRAKDEFLSVMNHELRTPLNVILMRAEILQSGIYGALTHKQDHSVDLILRSGHQLLAIIDDILDLVGIENRRLQPVSRCLSLRTVCEQCRQRVSEIAEKKKIQIEIEPLDEALFIYSDERCLSQILEKLLKNAIKFSAEGARIGLTVVADAPAEQVHITVWDTGIGIAPEDLPRLFQPFVQLEHSLTRRYDGAGVGLAIANRLTTLLGGTITVDSRLGAGSRFIVTLPMTLER